MNAVAEAVPRLIAMPNGSQRRRRVQLRRAVAFVAQVAAFALALKVLLLVLDPQMRLFMGDSATYFVSAIEHTTPPDRSFTYPFLIRLTAVVTGSVTTLLLLQTLFGVLTTTMVAGLLRYAWGVRPRLVWLAALIVALDPSQLFYERMIMTESASTFCLWVVLTAAMVYVKSGRYLALAACIVAGVALASLRVGLVPVALAMPMAAVLVRWPAQAGLRLKWIVLMAATFGATLAGHTALKLWYAQRTGGAPAYLHDAGLYRLGLVAPLVKPAYFEGTGVDPAFLSTVTIPLHDPRLRESQIWQPGGLIARLKAVAGDRATEVGAIVAHRAMSDQPWGMLRMGIATQMEFFDAERRHQRLQSDIGAEQAPDERTLSLLQSTLRYDARNLHRTPSLVREYYVGASPWLIVSLFFLGPVAVAVALLERRRRGELAVLLAGVGAGLFGGQILCSHIISYRYLHPVSTLFGFALVLLAEACWARMQLRQRRTAEPVPSAKAPASDVAGMAGARQEPA